MTSYSGASYDQFVHRTDDSKAHKLKSAYWTTKQVMIKKFKRKEDENVVASDLDLDSKLELLKSVQKTCRDLMTILVRYQDTLCYLSQSESEMGRFLKRYSLEDKTQAGKMMSAAGKALSHSAQQRLLLRSPLERVLQEVKTFRQRAISDTMSTLNRMEAARTEYRGALLWMKHVSEELDPDTYKQLEKFRRVQAQVKKTKTTFDRLKIDSMQKIDLLSASRCNMLSHALVFYQNSLLTFLEKTSRTMVAVADRFRGYQYYEFSVLKHLRPESKRLAGLADDNPEEVGEEPKDTSDNDRSTRDRHEPSEEELDRRLDEILCADVDDSKDDSLLYPTGVRQSDAGPCFMQSWAEFLANSSEDMSAEHRDLLTELFGPSETSSSDPTEQNRRPDKPSEFEVEWQSVFGQTSAANDAQNSRDSNAVPGSSLDEPWDSIRLSNSSALPSKLWDQRDVFATDDDTAKKEPTQGAKPPKGSGKQNPTNLDAWMKLFSDLSQSDPNPDAISKQNGQITDA